MGYGSVILVIGTILIAGVLLLSMDSATGDADEELNEYHYKELAQDGATTGLELTVRRLAASKAAQSWTAAWAAANEFSTTDYQKGTFRTEMTAIGNPIGDTVDVIARGFHGTRFNTVTDQTEKIAQVIYARYVREYADGGIPPSFRNVITTDLYIQFKGNVEVLAINSLLNANVHTNGDLITNGNSFFVEGYGTYTGVELSNQEDNFQPNQDYNGPEPNVFWADSVLIPRIDVAGLRNIAQTSSGVYINTGDASSFVVDGDNPFMSVLDFTNPASLPWFDDYPYVCNPSPCGTQDNPFIMFVEGPLHFVNRVEVRGYGNIISTGNVTISPNGSGGGMFGQLVDDETILLLATTQDINIGQAGGNTCMGLGPPAGNQHCQSGDGTHTHGVTLYAEGAVQYQGTPYMIGGIVAPDVSFDGNGTPTIIYASPTEEIIDPGFEFIIPIGPILIAYSEW